MGCIMKQQEERELTLACVGNQSAGSTSVVEALSALFPGASVVAVDMSVERVIPEPVDCAVVDATTNAADGMDVLRRLRAGGYTGAAVLVLDPARRLNASDESSADRLGVRRCEIDEGPLTPLAVAVGDALAAHATDAVGGPTSIARAVRQTQRLVAAGDLALRLQHSLNNPLAALLAEAQLLELEPLAPDHRESVERIIELSRRVIDVVRGLDGVGRA
jgi:signal transduction histidine kinase